MHNVRQCRAATAAVVQRLSATTEHGTRFAALFTFVFITFLYAATIDVSSKFISLFAESPLQCRCQMASLAGPGSVLASSGSSTSSMRPNTLLGAIFSVLPASVMPQHGKRLFIVNLHRSHFFKEGVTSVPPFRSLFASTTT